MELVVVRVALEVVDRLLPVCREDILVLAVEALMDICPRARVQLCRRVPLGGQLAVLRSDVSGSGRARTASRVAGPFGRGKQTAALAPGFVSHRSAFLPWLVA